VLCIVLQQEISCKLFLTVTIGCQISLIPVCLSIFHLLTDFFFYKKPNITASIEKLIVQLNDLLLECSVE
jgi:hypothetical protein